MPQSYVNPFAGSLGPEQVPNNPFASRANILENREMTAPFRQMEQQRQGLDLQQEQLKAMEYASPEAVAGRKSDLTAKLAKQKFESAEFEAKFARLPQEEKVKIAELRNKLMSEEAKPHQAFIKTLGEMAIALEKTPEQMRPAVHQDILRQFQAQNPGAQVPPQFQQYSPEVMRQASNLRLAQIMTPAHEQAMKLEVQKETGAMDRQREQSRATLGAAAMRERGENTRQATRIAEANKQNPGQFRVAQRRIMNDPKSTPEQVEVAEANLAQSLTDDMQKIWSSDQLLGSLSIAAMNDPTGQAQQKFDARKNKLYEDRLITEGIRVRVIDPTGEPGTIPKSKLDGALKAGFKLTK